MFGIPKFKRRRNFWEQGWHIIFILKNKVNQLNGRFTPEKNLKRV
jgi:hypothetical protein